MITADELRGVAPFLLPRGIKRVQRMEDNERERILLAGRLRAKASRERNAERVKAYKAEWARKNRERRNEQKREWAARNPERAKAIAKKASRKFRAKMTREQKTAWSQRCRDYLAQHRDRINAQRRARTAKRRIERENRNAA